MKIIITGCAGFIGSSLTNKLLKKHHKILGLDNLCNSYNIIFKKNNLSELNSYSNFSFHKIDILDNKTLNKVFARFTPDIVIHLAALTGVRKSLLEPELYQKVNVAGTINVCNASIKNKVKSFIFSSSSSVYGNRNLPPFRETQKFDPQSPYAKSKMMTEIELKKLHSYYKLPITILRFFSVYGPKSRPDLAPYLFTQAAFSGQTINQFGDGNSARDYTFVDDVISAIEKSILKQFNWEVINIGNSSPIRLANLILEIEQNSKKRIKKNIKNLIQAESIITHADISKAKKLLNWQPTTNFKIGIDKFITWYKKYRL